MSAAPARRADGRRGAPSPGLGAPVGPGRRSRRNARARRQRADQPLRPARLGSLCVWFPGGGWVLDTLDTSAPALSYVAAEAPCAFAVVRYRLAPEHPFPAPLDDCLEALRRLVAEAAQLGIDPSRIAVGGTSAGANLAAALALVSREPRARASDFRCSSIPRCSTARTPNRCAVTSRPSTGATSSGAGRTTSRADDGENALASPLLADLRGLPPALIVTAEHDPLRDEASSTPRSCGVGRRRRGRSDRRCRARLLLGHRREDDERPEARRRGARPCVRRRQG